jgi:hypothetical protein
MEGTKIIADLPAKSSTSFPITVTTSKRVYTLFAPSEGERTTWTRHFESSSSKQEHLLRDALGFNWSSVPTVKLRRPRLEKAANDYVRRTA